MRIVLAAQQSEARWPVPAYDFWPVYFRGGLEEGGHASLEIAGVDWAAGLALRGPDRDEWRLRTWGRVVDEVRRLHREGGVDLFLGYLFPEQVEPDAVQEIRGLGIPCVNFFCDNVRELTAVPDAFRGFDLHWVPEVEAVGMYRAAGLQVVHLPMPAWVDPRLRTSDHPEEHGVTFVGSRDAERERLFADALRLGAEIELRGSGWVDGHALSASPAGERRRVLEIAANQVASMRRDGLAGWTRKVARRWRPPVPEAVFGPHVRPAPTPAEYPLVLQRSVVTLGVSRYPSFRHPSSRPGRYSRLRDVEAPMLGACYLTEWSPGIDALYDVGSEIETYETAEELVEKARALVGDPARRRELRRRGQARALADHTIPRSIERIATRMGIVA